MTKMMRTKMMNDSIKVPLIPDCSACIINSLKTQIPLLTSDEEKQFALFQLAYKRISEGYEKNLTPLVLSVTLYRELSEVAGVPDPYQKIKHDSNVAAAKALPAIEDRMQGLEAVELFRAALAAAIAGNVIDFNTAYHRPDLGRLVETFDDILSEGFAPDDSKHLWRALISKKGTLLYLADNAGEIILDIPLVRFITSLGWKVVFAVKGQAMINDATREDVNGTELERLVEIVDTGAWSHGVPAQWVSKEFLQLASDADLVISKGQANIETFPEIQQQTGVETYYITRAKCPHIASAIGASIGSNVVVRRPSVRT
jgi:uncharacterized protein with ATP-grasp and redox domains